MILSCHSCFIYFWCFPINIGTLGQKKESMKVCRNICILLDVIDLWKFSPACVSFEHYSSSKSCFWRQQSLSWAQTHQPPLILTVCLLWTDSLFRFVGKPRQSASPRIYGCCFGFFFYHFCQGCDLQLWPLYWAAEFPKDPSWIHLSVFLHNCRLFFCKCDVSSVFSFWKMQ